MCTTHKKEKAIFVSSSFLVFREWKKRKRKNVNTLTCLCCNSVFVQFSVYVVFLGLFKLRSFLECFAICVAATFLRSVLSFNLFGIFWSISFKLILSSLLFVFKKFLKKSSIGTKVSFSVFAIFSGRVSISPINLD